MSKPTSKHALQKSIEANLAVIKVTAEQLCPGENSNAIRDAADALTLCFAKLLEEENQSDVAAIDTRLTPTD